MTKHTQKEVAFKLRKLGYSYSFIQTKTNVSKGTLSHWLSGIPFIANEETINKIGLARAKSAEAKAKIKQESFRKAKDVAKRDIKSIDKHDLFMIGLGLYIGEGSKTDGIVRFINSNPKTIRLAILWFQKCCGLNIDNFSIRLHIYPDNDVNRSIAYWSEITGIPRNKFQKTQVDWRRKKESRRGKLPYGTAHLNIKSGGEKEFGVFLSRRISAWIDEIYNKAGLV